MNRITLANLHEATEQQVFDQVVAHMFTQMVKAIDEDSGGCLYKHSSTKHNSTLSCAAGCLITDDEYKEIYHLVVERGELITCVSWSTLCVICSISDNCSNLISKLQFIHDNSKVHRWGPELKLLAKQRDLIWRYN